MKRFNKVLPWIVALGCFVAFVASFSEVRRLRHPLYHRHADVREFMIRAALAEAEQPIVVLGDSTTEMAPLPRELCGHPVVNAGVGGMSISEGSQLAARLFDRRQPFLIVSALGANDIGSASAGRNYSELLKTLISLSPRVVSVSDVTDDATNAQIRAAASTAEIPYIEPQLPPGSMMKDGIHFTGAAYRVWVPAIEEAIRARLLREPLSLPLDLAR